MKNTTVVVLTVWMLATCTGAGTIVYSYDQQHRLAGVNYDNQATATYRYDKANNVTGFTVLTDSQYFKPFLLYFTLLDTCPRTDELRLRPISIVGDENLNGQYGTQQRPLTLRP